MLPVVLWFSVLIAQSAVGAPRVGTVFEKDSNREKVLFSWVRRESGPATHKSIETEFLGPDGGPALVEKAIVREDAVQSYTLLQKQTDEAGKMEIRGDKLRFEYTRNGKTETNEEDVPDHLVCNLTVVPYRVRPTISTSSFRSLSNEK